MFDCRALRVASWTASIACGVGIMGAAVAATQSSPTNAEPRSTDTRPISLDSSPTLPVHQEMDMLQRHARVDMILYPGRFDQRGLAGNPIRPDAFALKLTTGTK